MFIQFFTALRQTGISVTPGEWLCFQEALDRGMANNSLQAFYYLARMILVKRETDFDAFDQVFERLFLQKQGRDTEIGAQMLRWLDKEDWQEAAREGERPDAASQQKNERPDIDRKEVEERFRQRLRDQDGEHNGGSFWIGNFGKTSFGNAGGSLGGVRVGGKTGNQSAFSVVGERKYRDFRKDKILDNRQFTLAFRKLREFSAKLDIPETELDLDGTIQKTCAQGGLLHIAMQKPRRNSVKLLLLMDSGGTMIPFTHLLNDLFQAIHKSNHYKDVQTYYFHNCVYSKLYKSPECENGDWVDTEWVIRKLDKDYKLLLVGDAAMAPEELYSDTGNYRGPNGGRSGYEWLQLLKKSYKRLAWLNPKMAPGHAPWREAETAIKEMIPMYRLSIDGLNQALVSLLKKK